MQQIELLGQELEVLREPRQGLSVKHKRGIILQARYLLDRYPDASPYDIHSLIDTGCEILGVVGWELIARGTVRTLTSSSTSWVQGM